MKKFRFLFYIFSLIGVIIFIVALFFIKSELSFVRNGVDKKKRKFITLIFHFYLLLKDHNKIRLICYKYKAHLLSSVFIN